MMDGTPGTRAQAAASSPGVLHCRIRQHRHVSNMVMAGGPSGRQIGQIEPGAIARTPVDFHRPPNVTVNGVFHQRLDRREARATRKQNHRLGRFVAQEKTAIGTLKAQDVLFLHAAEDMTSEFSVSDQANMELQEAVIMWRVGDGKRATLAVLQQELDVLPGEKLQALVGRQLEVQHDDVISHALDPLHAAGHDLDRNVLGCADFTAFQHQV